MGTIVLMIFVAVIAYLLGGIVMCERNRRKDEREFLEYMEEIYGEDCEDEEDYEEDCT